MAQVNTALAEDLQGLGGGFMGPGTCQGKGRVCPKAGYSQRQDFPKSRVCSLQPCPLQVTWLGQAQRGPLLPNNARLISRTEAQGFPLSQVSHCPGSWLSLPGQHGRAGSNKGSTVAFPAPGVYI